VIEIQARCGVVRCTRSVAVDVERYGAEDVLVLDAWKAAPVDVISTDVKMPNMNVIELLKAIRSDPAHRATPILILTTEADAAKKDEGRAAGATGWIVKPFDPAKLVQVVNKVCP